MFDRVKDVCKERYVNVSEIVCNHNFYYYRGLACRFECNEKNCPVMCNPWYNIKNEGE